MKLGLLILFSHLVCISNTNAQSWSDAIIGKWKSEDGKTIVEIYKSGNIFYGKIAWMLQPNDASGKPRTDIENPDPSKRNRPLMGLTVLENLEFKDGYWQNGEIYNSHNGESYNCDSWFEGADILKVKIYWYFMHETETWTRVK